MLKQLTKEAANYRLARGYEHCGNCVVYQSGGSCTLVKGNIRPTDTCDHWEKRDPNKFAP